MRNGMRLISVVLGSPSDEGARGCQRRRSSTTATPSSRRCRLKAAHDTVLKPRVYKSAAEFAAVGVPTTSMSPWRAARARACKTSARLSHEPLLAPLAAGQNVGELTVADGTGQVIARVPLVALAAVPQGGLWTRADRQHGAVVSLTRSAHG